MKRVQGTSRSQAAKDRIVAAARSVFAEVGYERATVRQIAERASVVPAMLVRYFGGKAGVFAAAIQFDLVLPSFEGMDYKAASEILVTHVTRDWDTSGSGGDLVALLRASLDHTEAKERLVSIFYEQLNATVKIVTGVKGERAAALIASQLLGLVFCRYVLEIPALHATPRDKIISSVGDAIESYLAKSSSDNERIWK
ncbi:TetR family transcriptional regulator [Sphingomonas sp. RHCKR7]|uniref:TetR/AcrR family transcriptional regulator n=1 Tax=Sphingomonas folli TaxID=2862497 RepID=UPI001CA562EA|nr:TetR family transcriptional regulator [Sphingomonas folli]MBW6528962.1 TetR family transcriptional regulator [Sphingomonas folli]